MSTENHKSLVQRIAGEIWNEGNLHVADEVMSADAHYHGPHMPNGIGGREDWKNAIKMYRGAFPDSHVVYEEMLVAGDRIVGRWSATGTHTGDLSGLSPTNQRIQISGITIYKISGGLIIEAWEQLDLLGMWEQIDVFQRPGPH